MKKILLFAGLFLFFFSCKQDNTSFDNPQTTLSAKYLEQLIPYIETRSDGYILTIDRQEALSKGISAAAYNSVAAHYELLNRNIRKTLEAGGTVCFGTPCTEEELAYWQNKIEEYADRPIVTLPLLLTKGEPWDEWGSLIGSDTGPDQDGYVGYLPLTFAEGGQKIKVAESHYRTMIITIMISKEERDKFGWQVNGYSEFYGRTRCEFVELRAAKFDTDRRQAHIIFPHFHENGLGGLENES